MSGLQFEGDVMKNQKLLKLGFAIVQRIETLLKSVDVRLDKERNE